MMNDLISRQAAIDALGQIFDQCEEIEAHLPEGDPDRTGYKMFPDYMTVWKYLHQLPSAEPEQRNDYARGYNDAKREIVLSGEYERAYQRGKADAQQWIPCSERLPKNEDIYLVAFDKSNLLDDEIQVSDAYWINNQWQYSVLESYEHRMPNLVIDPIEELKVIAWMPLPEPYKGEES